MSVVTVDRRAMRDVLVVGLALAAAYAPAAPEVTERWFSVGLYPHLQQALTPFSNLVPFAVLDVLMAAGVAVVVLILWRGLTAVRRARRIVPLFMALRRLIVGAAAVYLAFLLLWGFNYRRVSMTDRLVLEPGGPTSDDVARLGMQAVERLNALHEPAHQSGWREAPWQNATLRDTFAAVQRDLSEAPVATLGRLKSTALGPYLRWASIDGLINPFGLEVLANPDLLPFERPFVAAHEWAHLAGYADEAEASFVGWLACVRADPGSAYSGWLGLYWQISSELGEGDRTSVASMLAPGPRRDLEAVVARVRSGEWPFLQSAGWRLYDSYLKANRVEEGIRSYGAVLTLLLRARFDAGWVPARRAAAPGG
jgi:hypothetical protein